MPAGIEAEYAVVAAGDGKTSVGGGVGAQHAGHSEQHRLALRVVLFLVGGSRGLRGLAFGGVPEEEALRFALFALLELLIGLRL